MKKFLTLLLLTLSVMSSYAYDVEIDGIYYDLISKAKQASVTHNSYGSYSGNIVIPEKITSEGIEYSVTSIGDDAFSGCSLTSIQIPNSIKSIGNSAFNGCGLSSIQIPNSVTSIGDAAFSGSSLTSIQIPNSVTNIGICAFEFCRSLASVQLSNSVTTIMEFSFHGCRSLTSLQVPNSVRHIGYDAFANCTSLISIQIPNSEIGYEAFANCENLVNITFGSGVDGLSEKAFANCPKLENIYCYAVNPPSIISDPFERSYIEYANLYVPAESVGSYRNASPWSDFGTISALSPVEPEDIDLTDGGEYTNVIEKSCSTLTYTRNFTNTNWNALYVPFAMNYDDWANDFEIARLNDVHQFDDDEDGVIDRTVLESVKLKAGSSIEPNTPYMIKAKEVGEKTITLTDATLYATEENSFDVTSWYTKFTFTGTYNTVTDMATAGHYALADGGLKQASSDAVTLGAFRWYLDITDRNGAPAQIKGRKVLLSFDDGETTEISVVPADAASNSSEIFTLSGAKVGNDKASLSKGLYISNGKKILVK